MTTTSGFNNIPTARHLRQSQHTSENQTVNYYSILGLPLPSGDSYGSFTKDGLRNAYHKALLLNHPDKFARNGSDTPVVSGANRAHRQHSVDKIITAYQTLADPQLKIEYDQWLLTTRAQPGAFHGETIEKRSHAGVEAFDLEDLTYAEEEGIWSKSCRCGDEQGYVLREQDLEQESRNGEIFVGCHGCSLFIRVLFAVVDADSEETMPQLSDIKGKTV